MQRLGEGRLIDEAIDHIDAYYHGSILLGSEEYVGGKVYNTAFLLGPDRSSLQRYRKVYLVVLGEYIPWADIFPWLTQWWGRGISATAGTEPGHLALAREGLSIAPLMCFEDTQPQVVNAAAARGPDFLVTMINAGWYSGRLANWCLRQHLENATLRCVEHDRPMLRCGDTGISCAIDADGRVVAMLPEQAGDPLEVRGILSGRLFLYPWESTLYERWGDWVGALCRWGTLGVGVAWLVRVRKKWFRERNQIGN
jgi:apolipoprotein N-acyltransferase